MQPCSICIRRKKESECLFSDTPARLLRPGNTKAQHTGSRKSSDSTVATIGNRSEMAIDKLLNYGGANNKEAELIDDEGASSPGSTAPVPRSARLLRDGRGKFMYIGDSASLSFLQSIRRLVASSLGECEFTTDPMRHSIVETISHQPSEASPGTAGLNINNDKAYNLAYGFLTATSGLIDLFVDTLIPDLDAWISNPSREEEAVGPLYYHVLAIGAQVEGDQDLAERCFAHGRRLAYLSNIDSPSVLTVQIFILMPIYLLGACRRNAAYMSFGIACRGAIALGMHKSNTHSLFEDTELKARIRTWRGVRALDMFFSGTLGRPPATSDLASDSILENDCSHFHATDKISQKVLVLCGITERILLDVWEKKAASTRLADAISRRYRDWTADLPPELQLHNSANNEVTRDLRDLLTASHIITSYHCSIILLTRPFLTHQIVKDMNKRHHDAKSPASSVDVRETSTMKTFADACVDSALRNISIAHSLISYAALPKRLPVILDAVCNSSLVLGAAAFADQDKNFPLLDGLDQGLQVLNHFAPQDPHAHRYAEVITYLYKAVKMYTYNRNQEEMQSRSEKVARLFGNVDHGPSGSVGDTLSVGTMTEQVDATTDVQNPYNPFLPDLGPLANYNSQYLSSDLDPYLSTPYYHLATFQTPGVGFGQMPSFGDNMDGDLSFLDNAYMFAEQDTSMFGLWDQ